MRRALAFLTCLLAVLSFAACGSQDYGLSDVTFETVTVSADVVERNLKEFVYGADFEGVTPETEVSDDLLDRTAFSSVSDEIGVTGGELGAARRIERMLKECGYGAVDGQARATLELVPFEVVSRMGIGANREEVTRVSQNIVARLAADGVEEGAYRPRVVIGASYDNTFRQTGAHGVYGGGIGVATVLALAEALREVKLPFDVYFVAFGAGEAGNCGSQDYVQSTMSLSDRKSTLLMASMQYFGGGDAQYLFCDDTPTVHERLIRAAHRQTGSAVRLLAPPADKRAWSTGENTLAYLHSGLLGDNHSFFVEGINTAAFPTMAWDKQGEYGYAESARYDDIINTAQDTLEGVLSRYPQAFTVAAAVASTLATTLTASDFVEACVESRRRVARIAPLRSNAVAAWVYGGLVLLGWITVAILTRVLSRRKPPQKPDPLFNEVNNTPLNTKDDQNPFAGY